MTDVSYQELAHTQFNHALTLFRDAYGPYVLARMQEHFGENLATHLDDLATRGMIFIDYDSDQNISFDVNAIIYLLTEDGGLRKGGNPYEPTFFWCAHRPNLPHVLFLPSVQRLLDLRATRNKWAHQRNVPFSEYREKTATIIDCMKRLPEPYNTKLKIMQLQFIKGQFQVYQSQAEISHHIDAQQQHVQAQQSATILDIQQKIDTVVPQLDTALTTLTHKELPQLYNQITQIQQDQVALLTGIFGALSDTKLLTDAQIGALRADIQALHDTNVLRDSAFAQLRMVREDVTLQQSHIQELTMQLTGMHQQLAEVRQQLADTQHQLTTAHRDSTTIAQQLSTHLRDASVVPPHTHTSPLPAPAPTSPHWRWVAVLLLLSVIGGVGALVWLGYVPVMK